MSLSTRKGATQKFTVHLTVPDGQSITTDHTIIWMVKRFITDSDESAVLVRRLSDGGLTIENDGATSGEAELSGVISAEETVAIFAEGNSFVTEVRVITPSGVVQPRAFQNLTLQDTVVDQITHDE